jgi:hypothetical protein
MISLLNTSESLHFKLAAAVRPAEDQFLCAAKNTLKFLTLHVGILRLILSSKKGHNLVSEKHE